MDVTEYITHVMEVPNTKVLFCLTQPIMALIPIKIFTLTTNYSL